MRMEQLLQSSDGNFVQGLRRRRGPFLRSATARLGSFFLAVSTPVKKLLISQLFKTPDLTIN